MKSMVVLFALCAVACGSLVVPAQPAHYPALVLDPHGRPFDTAEVINARALHLTAKALEHHAPLAHYAPLAHSVIPAVVAVPAAVSHQSRVDVHSSPAVLAHAAPVWGSHAALASPLLAQSVLGLYGHSHWLKKRSPSHLAYSAPITHVAHIAPSAVSHQSRIDVISTPAVVSHAVDAPVVSHAIAAPLVVHVAPSAVSHQSRVDVRTSPAVVTHSVVAAPVHSAWAAPAHSAWAAPTHSAWAAPAVHGAHSLALGHGYGHGLGLGHLLKKRSLALAHAATPLAYTHATPVAFAHDAPAVSQQSRIDVISSHAIPVAPITVAHAPIAFAHAAPAVSHQSRVDVISSAAHIAPIAHSAVWTAPASHWAHSGLLNSASLAHGALW